MVGRVIFPMEGESAAPDMATAVGKLRPFELMIDSYDDVPTMPTEGPPMYSEVKTKLAAARPGGVALIRDVGRRAHDELRTGSSATLRQLHQLIFGNLSCHDFVRIGVAVALAPDREGRRQASPIERVHRPGLEVSEVVQQGEQPN